MRYLMTTCVLRPTSYVLTSVERAWPYRVKVIAHVAATTIATHLPPQTLVEPLDDNTCRVHLGSDSPRIVAAWLGTLDADFDIESAEAHPQLIEHLHRVAGRYQRAGRV